MNQDYLPKFRRQLFDWLQLRLADHQMPFRRVEETPELLTGSRLAAPDLVLWINRDSLLAGAMILAPAKVDPILLAEGAQMAGSLGLRQFVTWEARAVNLWAAAAGDPELLKSWPVPGAKTVSSVAFAAIFEQLLQELKNQAVLASLPPAQLPPAYFANLCLQVLRDLDAPLAETARVKATTGKTERDTLHAARDKGWLTLWRILLLLWHDHFPRGIRPERLERAIGYALADPDGKAFRFLLPATGEVPLPESAAIRFHHLAGRLAQLGWRHEAARAGASLRLLLSAAARCCRVETAPLGFQPDRQDVLINHLPALAPAEATLVAPLPCLAGLELLAATFNLSFPGTMQTEVAMLNEGCRPQRIVANLRDPQPLSSQQRRQRMTALRHPWPYRRFKLSGDTPAWLWDALHLGGLADPEGQLILTLPGNWVDAAAADLLWQTLAERYALTELHLHVNGGQTLTLVGHDRAPDFVVTHRPDGSQRRHPLLSGEAGVAEVAALITAPLPPAETARVNLPRRKGPDTIADKVFRDGLPSFPEHYLRRIDLPPLRTHQLPGPLQPDSHFFDRIRLTSPDGSCVDSDNPVEAEALLLASLDGRSRVDLPVDPALILTLIAAYRHDLKTLWQSLLDECRRHQRGQRAALAMARRLWRERALPSMDND